MGAPIGSRSQRLLQPGLEGRRSHYVAGMGRGVSSVELVKPSAGGHKLRLISRYSW